MAGTRINKPVSYNENNNKNARKYTILTNTESNDLSEIINCRFKIFIIYLRKRNSTWKSPTAAYVFPYQKNPTDCWNYGTARHSADIPFQSVPTILSFQNLIILPCIDYCSIVQNCTVQNFMYVDFRSIYKNHSIGKIYLFTLSCTTTRPIPLYQYFSTVVYETVL